jgi:hypothetical protein
MNSARRESLESCSLDAKELFAIGGESQVVTVVARRNCLELDEAQGFPKVPARELAVVAEMITDQLCLMRRRTVVLSG